MQKDLHLNQEGNIATPTPPHVKKEKKGKYTVEKEM